MLLEPLAGVLATLAHPLVADAEPGAALADEAGIDAEGQARSRGLKSAEHFAEQWFVERAGVQLNPGSNYGVDGAGHMRMNLAAPRPVIAEALQRIEDAVRRV